MKIQHNGITIYLENYEVIVLKKAVNYCLADGLLTHFFDENEKEKLRWLKEHL